ncbi:MAG: hypothetical protein P4L81_01860 [Candidatus Pacebacteria bacterium]|nr:hypothetical protein [Candidatus Paceibacterota bacterium]
MSLKQLLLWCVGLIALLFVLSAPTHIRPTFVAFHLLPAKEEVRVPPAQPMFTNADSVDEQENQPFQFLVSYTDTGFEARITTVEVGETVRFTNNSTGQLWVAATGTQLYPSIQNGCGSSALDSCRSLQPGEFWQFTFTKKGTWDFVNNLDKTKQGAIVVL